MISLILEPKNKIPMYQQIYEAFRRAMEKGEIQAEEKLPSKRELAAYLNVSQTTVETAYAQLIAEGYAYAKAKSGYYAEALMAQTPSAVPQKSPCRTEAIEANYYRYDFKTGGMDVDSFPFALWAKLTREVLNEDKNELLNATEVKGYLPLRQEIVGYLREYRGISAEPEQVVVGAGWEYLLGLIIQLLGRGYTYGVEDPGYGKMGNILQKNDCPTVYLPVDGEGVSAAALGGSAADIVHVTPSHQFPLGVVTSANRRRALLSWAAEKPERYIIEDDYDSEFRLLGRPIPAMYGLDRGENVIYIKTLTRSLAPSLRMAYMVLPPSLMARFEREMSFYASTVPSIEQHVLYRFMAGGAFHRHLNRLRTQYKKRRELFLEAVKASPSVSLVDTARENGGMHLLLRAAGQSEKALVTKAAAAGIRVYGVSQYYTVFSPWEYADTVLCGFSAMSEAMLKEAVTALLKAWE